MTALAKPTPAGPGQRDAWYREVNGPLFGREVSADDVRQGVADDCAFDASLAAIAQTHPDAIRRMFRESADGSVFVTFHREGRTIDVRVDRWLPVAAAPGATSPDNALPGPLFNKTSFPGGPVLWPALAEKAFAQLHGGYDDIADISMDWVLHELTGERTESFTPECVSPIEVFHHLEASTRQGRPTIASTHKRSGHEADFDAMGMRPDGYHPIIDDHGYSVLGTAERNGQRSVVLRNPWGVVEPGNDGRDDGVFQLPLDDFMRLFNYVTSVLPEAASVPFGVTGPC